MDANNLGNLSNAVSEFEQIDRTASARFEFSFGAGRSGHSRLFDLQFCVSLCSGKSKPSVGKTIT